MNYALATCNDLSTRMGMGTTAMLRSCAIRMCFFILGPECYLTDIERVNHLK